MKKQPYNLSKVKKRANTRPLLEDPRGRIFDEGVRILIELFYAIESEDARISAAKYLSQVANDMLSYVERKKSPIDINQMLRMIEEQKQQRGQEPDLANIS